MPFSTSNSYSDFPLVPHLTSQECSLALTDFMHSSVDLSVATEASSHPSGLKSLFAQPYYWAGGGLGNLDECNMQVCLAGGNRRDSLTAFGSVCIPYNCTALDLAADDFVATLKRSTESASNQSQELAYEYYTLNQRIAELNRFLKTGWTCGNYKVDFSILPFGGLYSIVSVILVGLTILSSCTSSSTNRRRRKSTNPLTSDDHVEEVNPDDDMTLNKTTPSNQNQILLYYRILAAWDVETNFNKLFHRRQATACLDGLRVLSILWVILGHVMAIQSSSGGGYSNPQAFLPPYGLTTTIPGQLLFAARFAVDTFFFISGFLVVHVLCSKMPLNTTNNRNVLMRYLIHIPSLLLLRILRILPLYGMTLGFWTQVAPHLGSGPFWYQWQLFLEPCRKYGWTNWVFVNNFFPPDTPNVETCFYHSWYLAVDMQLFMLAPLLVFFYQANRMHGKFVTSFLMLCSFASTMGLAYTRRWSINTFDGAAVARFDIEGYAKPHIRAQTYLAGMLLGMMLYPLRGTSSSHLQQQQQQSPQQEQQRQPQRSPQQMSSFTANLFIMASITILFGVTFITSTGAYARRPCKYEEWPELSQCGSTWTSTQTFWYAATSRALWACAIALIAWTCLVGQGGLVNHLLSLSIMTPLSHLSFGAYLLHPIVIFVYQFGDRQKEPFRLLTFGLDFLAVSLISFVLALCFTLVVELPFANLSRIFFANNSRRLPSISDVKGSNEIESLLPTTMSSNRTKEVNQRQYGSTLDKS